MYFSCREELEGEQAVHNLAMSCLVFLMSLAVILRRRRVNAAADFVILVM